MSGPEFALSTGHIEAPVVRLLRRRMFVQLIVSGVAMTVLAACGAAQPTAPTPPSVSAGASSKPSSGAAPASSTASSTASPAATAAPVTSSPVAQASGAVQPKSGGTLVWAVGSDLPNLDGHITG